MPQLTWRMKDGTWEITSLTFLPESEKNLSPSREHRFIRSHCAGSKHPHCTLCVGNPSFSYAAHPDAEKISRCFTHTIIRRYDHHQSLYHFPSPEPALPAKLISNTDWLSLVCIHRSTALHSLQCWRANTASFFSAKSPIFNSILSMFGSLQWSVSNGNPSSHFHRTYFTPSHSRILTWSLLLVIKKTLMSSTQLCCSFLPCSLAARIVWVLHAKRNHHDVKTYGGLSHFRCLNRTPVPHVRLHMLHWLHMLQSPSTCSGMGVLLTHSPARHHWNAIVLAQAGKEPRLCKHSCTGGLRRMSGRFQQVHV